MYRLNRHLILLLLIVATAINLPARDFTYDIDFKSVFDNREGDNNLTATKTIFFTNLAPEIGISFNEGADALKGGVVWNQPIGCEWHGSRVSPTLYFRHEARKWNFTMGMLPRKYLHEELPDFLWCDSLAYFQHNIRGALVEAEGSHGFIDAYLDWRSMQSKTRREAFEIVVHGRYYPRGDIFFMGGHAMMNHYALTEDAPDDMHIVDNFMVNPYLGVDFSRHTALDSLMVRGGLLLTIERNRALDSGWKTPAGGWLEAVAQWRWLGLKNSLYAGGIQMPSWQQHGAMLYLGEPYYQCKFYDRVRVYADILRKGGVALRAELDFNFTNNSFVFYQKLSLSVDIGGKIKLK